MGALDCWATCRAYDEECVEEWLLLQLSAGRSEDAEEDMAAKLAVDRDCSAKSGAFFPRHTDAMSGGRIRPLLSPISIELG